RLLPCGHGRGSGRTDRGHGVRPLGIRARAGGNRRDRAVSPPGEYRAAARGHRAEGRARGMNAPPALGQDEALARIRLLRSPNVGPVSYARLLRRFGDARMALEALPDIAARGGKAGRPAPRERIEREVADVRAVGARYLFHDMAGSPKLLGQIE